MPKSTLTERLKCSLFFSGYGRLHRRVPAGWQHLGTGKSECVAASALPVLFHLSDGGECSQKAFSAGGFGALHLHWVNSNESALLRRFQGGCVAVLPYVKMIFWVKGGWDVCQSRRQSTRYCKISSLVWTTVKGVRGEVSEGVVLGIIFKE